MRHGVFAAAARTGRCADDVYIATFCRDEFWRRSWPVFRPAGSKKTRYPVCAFNAACGA